MDEGKAEELLKRAQEGDSEAREQLYSELSNYLRSRASRALPPGHTLQTTALINEVVIKLLGHEAKVNDHQHLQALASRAMRCVVIDHARAKGRGKRKGGERVPLDEIVVDFEERSFDLIALNEALDRLGEFDPGMAQAVELRFFGGLPANKVAACLGMPQRSYERDWAVTRAWLHRELSVGVD